MGSRWSLLLLSYNWLILTSFWGALFYAIHGVIAWNVFSRANKGHQDSSAALPRPSGTLLFTGDFIFALLKFPFAITSLNPRPVRYLMLVQGNSKGSAAFPHQFLWGNIHWVGRGLTRTPTSSSYLYKGTNL